jgi:hypothetical protein
VGEVGHQAKKLIQVTRRGGSRRHRCRPRRRSSGRCLGGHTAPRRVSRFRGGAGIHRPRHRPGMHEDPLVPNLATPARACRSSQA